MIIIIIVISALLFGIATAMVAHNKGKNTSLWFLLGFLFGPLGLIIALVSPKDELAIEERAISEGKMKKCPYCGELVKKEARICRYCGKDISPEALAADGIQIDEEILGDAQNIPTGIEDYPTIGELKYYAKKKGYSRAKYLLGKLFIEGELVERNVSYGKKWLQKAADEGFEEAIQLLKKLQYETE